jgi:uncharacterized membrane protein HdeD (DUF308 family)
MNRDDAIGEVLAEARESRGPLERMCSWCLGVGGLLLLLGIVAIAAPWAASKVVAWVVGAALLAAGLSQLGMAAGTYTYRGFWLTLVCGALALVAGTAMFAIPGVGIHALVTFLGVIILFEAAAKLLAAFSVPREFPRGWLLLDGVVTAVLGGILLMASEPQAALFLGVIVGINLVTSGVALLASRAWLRRALG